MKCNNIMEHISATIRSEINYPERVEIITHIQQCDSCRQEYIEELKIHYLQLKAIAEPHDAKLTNNFTHELMKSINHRKTNSYTKYWISAAAIFMIAVSVLFYPFNRVENLNPHPAYSLNATLKNDNWARLSDLFANPELIRPDEQVPVKLLLQKISLLKKLQKQPFLKTDIQKQDLQLLKLSDGLSSPLTEIEKTIKAYAIHKQNISVEDIYSYISRYLNKEVIS